MPSDGHVAGHIIVQGKDFSEAIVNSMVHQSWTMLTCPDLNYTTSGVGCAFKVGNSTYWCVMFR